MNLHLEKLNYLKFLSLQEKANVGNIHILGKNTNKLNRNEIAKLHNEISLVNEKIDLIYNLGVKENIILPLISVNKRAVEIETAVEELAWMKIDIILNKDTL